MCRIDSQLKKLIRLKYLIYETPYAFFSMLIWYFQFYTHFTCVFRYCLQQLFLFWFFQPYLFCVCFYNFSLKNIVFKYFQHLFNTVPIRSTFMSKEVFRTARRTLYGDLGILQGGVGGWGWGRLNNPLETILYCLTFISL